MENIHFTAVFVFLVLLVIILQFMNTFFHKIAKVSYGPF